MRFPGPPFTPFLFRTEEGFVFHAPIPRLYDFKSWPREIPDRFAADATQAGTLRDLAILPFSSYALHM